MPEDLESLQERCRADFARATGEPFKHFYCPILHLDESAELCRGHIVNDSLGGSSSKTVLQRRDVDAFYGCVAENRFVALIKNRNRPVGEVVLDRNMSSILRPRLKSGDRTVGFYPAQGDPPEHHTLLEAVGQPDFRFVVRESEQEVEKLKDLHFEIAFNCEYPAIASLIKAAHLTMFRLLGYSYALSLAGRFVGRDILGEFFVRHRDDPPAVASEQLESHFKEFRNMVRPCVFPVQRNLTGTVDDCVVTCLEGSSGRPFAIGVYVRTNEDCSIVILPGLVKGFEADGMVTFLDFIKSPPDTVTCRDGWFRQKERQFEMCETASRRAWSGGE